MKQLFFLLACLGIISCNNVAPSDQTRETKKEHPLRMVLDSLIRTSGTDVGVAIQGPDNDSISVNGQKHYAMMSVAKFGQALCILHMVDEGKFDKNQPIVFNALDLSLSTASSFRKDHPGNQVSALLAEALQYSIGQSDNITSQKIFELQGGPGAVADYIHGLGIKDIGYGTDYHHMRDDSLWLNWSTPVAMVELLEKFNTGSLLKDSSQQLLMRCMVEAISGPNRIKGLLPAGTVVAHKTGTSAKDDKGLYPALNDAGIVELPNGKHFSIAVFVHNAGNDTTAAQTIALISKAAWDYYSKK